MKNTPYVIAHRGGSKRAPENTISALKNGIRLQADYIEFDLQFTKDQVPVLFHDDFINRTTNGEQNLRIQDLTVAELKQLDAGSWFGKEYKDERIPTLEEVLQELDKQTKFFIEIKDPNIELTKRIVDSIKTHDIVNNVKILSFHKDVIYEVKRLLPELHTVMLFSKFKGNISTIMNDTHMDSFGLGQQLALLYKRIPKQLLQEGKEVFVYAVNNTYAINTLCKIGITGIITDQPLTTRKIIEKFNRKTPKQF